MMLQPILLQELCLLCVMRTPIRRHPTAPEFGASTDVASTAPMEEVTSSSTTIGAALENNFPEDSTGATVFDTVNFDP